MVHGNRARASAWPAARLATQARLVLWPWRTQENRGNVTTEALGREGTRPKRQPHAHTQQGTKQQQLLHRQHRGRRTLGGLVLAGLSANHSTLGVRL